MDISQLKPWDNDNSVEEELESFQSHSTQDQSQQQSEQIKQKQNFLQEQQLFIDYSEQNQKIETLSDKVSAELLKLKSGYDSEFKKLKSSFSINTSKARSEHKVLKYLIQLYKWKEVIGTEGDILWSGLSLNEDDCTLPLYIKTNRIPGMPDLCHKKTMGYYLNKFREYFPEEYDFFPRTFLIPEELEEFTEFSKNSKKIFIAKPSSGSQGDGIRIIKTPKELNLSCYTPKLNELIVQHYIHKPLLINNRKFDFRLYVLISSVSPFIVYQHEEGLARFCVEEYQTPLNEKNFKNVFMHLTNYSLNKDHPEFKPADQQTNIFEINDTSKRTLTSVLKELKQLNINVDQVSSDIEELLVKFLTSMYPFILNNMKMAFSQNQKPRCFHVLGFDILLDEKCKPWLLEVNNNPSFNIDHDVYKSDGTTTTEESDLDKFIKARVIGDAIMLTAKSMEKQLQIGNGNMYRGFKQIICGEIEDKQLELFTQILQIYGHLSGLKFKGVITASKFTKLAYFNGMTNQKVLKVDYDILFKKVLCNNQGTQHMDYFDFIKAIEILASKLTDNYDPENKLPSVSQLVSNIVSQIK